MEEAKKINNLEEEIKKILLEIFSLLNIEGSISVVKEIMQGEREETTFKVSIESQESGLLIGRHGETLNSLQLLLGVILYKKTNQWIRVVLDVGGYRRAREETLKEMATRIMAEVEEKKTPVTLPYLTPLERRFVHLLVAKNPNLTSVSEGVGKERRLIIKPK